MATPDKPSIFKPLTPPELFCFSSRMLVASADVASEYGAFSPLGNELFDLWVDADRQADRIRLVT
jgi:hypothetical protein